MVEPNARQVVDKARRRFLHRLEQGPATFTEAIRDLKLPEGKDGRLFGAMVAELHCDGIIRPVGYVPSINRCCHSRQWELVDNTKGGGRG